MDNREEKLQKEIEKVRRKRDRLYYDDKDKNKRFEVYGIASLIGLYGASGFGIYKYIDYAIKTVANPVAGLFAVINSILITIVGIVLPLYVAAGGGVLFEKYCDKRIDALDKKENELKNELERVKEQNKDLEKLKEDEEKANKATTKSVKAEQQVIDVESKEIVK